MRRPSPGDTGQIETGSERKMLLKTDPSPKHCGRQRPVSAGAPCLPLGMHLVPGKHVEDQFSPTSSRGMEAPETLPLALSASRIGVRALGRGITRAVTQPKSQPLGSWIGFSFVDHTLASFSVTKASVPCLESPSGVSLDYMFLPMAAGGLGYVCGGEGQV